MSDEQEKKITEALKVSKADAAEKIELLKALRLSPMWKVYSELLKEQQAERVKIILQPAEKLDDAFLQQYRTGAAWAFGSAAGDFLDFSIDYYQSILDEVTEIEEQTQQTGDYDEPTE